MNNTTKGSKVRPTLRVDPKTAQRVEQWYKAANCRSQNEFMERAINFYADYIEMNDNNDLLPQALQSYLEAIGVTEYDPLQIIQKTKGRMAEDQQWLEILP